MLARRGDLLAQRVGLMRDLVEELDRGRPGGGPLSGSEPGRARYGPETGRARVWIEGLPPYDHGAGLLLDEIARG